jgi:hypothetical protein
MHQKCPRVSSCSKQFFKVMKIRTFLRRDLYPVAIVPRSAQDNVNAEHQTVIIDGDFLDLRDDLYRYQADGDKKKSQNERRTALAHLPTPSPAGRSARSVAPSPLMQAPMALTSIVKNSRTNYATPLTKRTRVPSVIGPVSNYT